LKENRSCVSTDDLSLFALLSYDTTGEFSIKLVLRSSTPILHQSDAEIG